MKKILILILTLTLFSCQNTQNQENNSGNTEKISEEISEEITLPDLDDEDFLNSEENELNKQKARECLAKINGEDFEQAIVQAFEYNGECYYIEYSLNWDVFGFYIYTTNQNIGKYLEFGSKKLKVLDSKIDNIDNYYFKDCIHDRVYLEVNNFNRLDDIFLEYNIIPPRIIYTKEEFNEENFGFFLGMYVNRLNEKFNENEENLLNFKDFLNNIYKFRNLENYNEIKKTFDKANNFVLEEYLNGGGNCSFYDIKDKNIYDKINKIQEFRDIYNLDEVFKIKEELENML